MVLSERKKWLLAHRKFLLGVVLVSGLAALLLFLKLFALIPLAFILPVFLISILYSLPFLRVKSRRIPLRDVPFLKVFLIAGVWSLLTVLLPLLIAGEDLGENYNQSLLLRRFLFIFALTLLFDIRDVQKDTLAGTVTFPGRFGIVFTRILSGTFLLLFMALVLISETGLIIAGLEFSALVAGVVIFYTDESRSDYYFAILADGMMLLQFLAVWLFSC